MASYKQCINTPQFSFAVNRLRDFFLRRGFVETHTQNRLSILSACEDPETVRTFKYTTDTDGVAVWPLPQTGQMWLEYELLKQPELPGVFCVSTSYRQEPNPEPGRHLTIFPMFEFEMHGGLSDMKTMQTELLIELGYPTMYDTDEYPSGDYDDVCERFATDTLNNSHEAQLCLSHPVFFLEKFPEYTAPFWNMARFIPNEEPCVSDGFTSIHSKKIDVILSGQETIGSAERSCDPDQMLHSFETISDGEYAKLLYKLFGESRVQMELDQFLSHKFFPRSGGGIGVTRLMRSMELCGLVEKP